MQKIVVKTATEARNEFFDLLAAAKYGGQVTVVEKNGKRMARIVPDVEEKKIDWKAYKEAMKEFVGLISTEDARRIRQARLDSRKPRFPDW